MRSIRSPLDGFRSPFCKRPGGAPLVLTSFVDDLELNPPSVSFVSSQEGTLYIDYHTGAAPPALGAGDVGGTTQAITIGPWSGTLNLSAFSDQTFRIFFTLLYDTDKVSNTLISQEITVPGTAILDRFGSAVLDRAASPINARAV